MKTPQEIIDGLPEGNRKRALTGLAWAAGDKEFWTAIAAGEFGKAAGMLPSTPAHNVFADMIWEG